MDRNALSEALTALASNHLWTWQYRTADLLAALPTAAGNADAVWDEALAGHLGAGSTGEALNAAGAAGRARAP